MTTKTAKIEKTATANSTGTKHETIINHTLGIGEKSQHELISFALTEYGKHNPQAQSTLKDIQSLIEGLHNALLADNGRKAKTGLSTYAHCFRPYTEKSSDMKKIKTLIAHGFSLEQIEAFIREKKAQAQG